MAEGNIGLLLKTEGYGSGRGGILRSERQIPPYFPSFFIDKLEFSQVFTDSVTAQNFVFPFSIHIVFLSLIHALLQIEYNCIQWTCS